MRIDQADDAVIVATALRVIQTVGPYLMTPMLDHPMVEAIPDDVHQQVDEIVERLTPELMRVVRRQYPEGPREANDHPIMALSNALYVGAQAMADLLRLLATATVMVGVADDSEEMPSDRPHPGYL